MCAHTHVRKKGRKEGRKHEGTCRKKIEWASKSKTGIRLDVLRKDSESWQRI